MSMTKMTTDVVERIQDTKALADGQPREFWLQVSCTDVSDRDQLVERFRLEGRAVKLTTK